MEGRPQVGQGAPAEGSKKISFGFSKQMKRPPVVVRHEKKGGPGGDKVQMIDCLEGKAIKLKQGEEVEEKKPLIIPLKDKDRTSTAAVLARIAKEVEPDLDNDKSKKVESVNTEVQQAVVVENETLEQRAARELLEEAKNINVKEADKNTVVVPLAENVKIIGEKESTLEDYENIPIGDFGMAMLRGMGWQEGKGIGKSNKNVDLVLPKLRPKGMGLGADKVVIANKSDKSNGATNDEELKIVKGAFVKITAGKHVGSYGQITGFDEDSGRVIIKAAIGGTNINLSEFMIQAVTKDEYSKQSKVINAAKYEEYKMKEVNPSSDDRKQKRLEDAVKEERNRSSKNKHSSNSSDDEPSRSRNNSRKRDDDFYRNDSKKESNYVKKKESEYERKRESEYDRKKESEYDRKRESEYDRKKESEHERKRESEYDSRKGESECDRKRESEYDRKKESEYDRKRESEYDKKKELEYDKRKESEYSRRKESDYDKAKSSDYYDRKKESNYSRSNERSSDYSYSKGRLDKEEDSKRSRRNSSTDDDEDSYRSKESGKNRDKERRKKKCSDSSDSEDRSPVVRLRESDKKRKGKKKRRDRSRSRERKKR